MRMQMPDDKLRWYNSICKQSDHIGWQMSFGIRVVSLEDKSTLTLYHTILISPYAANVERTKQEIIINGMVSFIFEKKKYLKKIFCSVLFDFF